MQAELKPRLLRLAQILGRPATHLRPEIVPLIPVSRTTWWLGVKTGLYPQPVQGLGKNIRAWRSQDIDALVRAKAGNDE